MRVHGLGASAVLVAIALIAACGTGHRETIAERSEPLVRAPTGVTPSSEAGRRIDELRERFRVTQPLAPTLSPRSASRRSPAPVLGVGIATAFAATGSESVRAVIPIEAKRGVLRAASVDLPTHANAMVRLEDDTTHVSIGFALRDTVDAPIAVVDGIALYAGALAGNDVVHRVRAEGTEDFVVFEERPAREEIVYDVDVSRTAGVRLVSNTLEFLDESGTPRLRIAPPYVIDANGARRVARIALKGCAYDANAAAPWGRAVVRPGAPSCEVRVRWQGVVYPAMVDPSWVATGSMTLARTDHTATLLPSGQVLIAGGTVDQATASAELFDGSASFAATGVMTTARTTHTATLLPSGKVLIAGGVNGTNSNVFLSSAELFDGSGTFAATAGSMNTAREAPSATLLPSGKVLIAAGIGAGSTVLSSAELFDGSANFAPTAGSMITPRYSPTATLLLSGKVLIAGGVNGSFKPLASAELFDGSGTFSATDSMLTPRESHTATLLPSGEVLVAGGSTTGGAALSTAELFDGTATFTPTMGPMTAARRLHTATLLPSGKVLVAGGVDMGNDYLPSAELFDGGFVATSSMVVGRGEYTATLLLSGQVLAAGGIANVNGNGIITDAAELYGIPAGTPCVVGDVCPSGVCNENCCSGACAGTCTTCDATGACLPVTNAPDPDTCTGTMSCDANHTCVANTACKADADCSAMEYCDASGLCQHQKPKSSTCNTAAGADCKGASCPECTTGQCVDGFCCDTACGDQCEACDIVGHAGTCSPTKGTPHGTRTACTGTGGTCDSICDGATTALCTYPGATTVCASTCTNDKESPSECNGAGKCVAGQSVPCEPFACNGTTGCRTSCSSDTDCADGFRCSSGGKCTPKAGATCAADGHTVVDPAGTPRDCTPYVCAGGMCTETCASVDDCVAPNVCDPNSKCTAPSTTPGDSGDSGGCAFVDAPNGGTSRAPILLIALGLFLAASRRRRGV